MNRVGFLFDKSSPLSPEERAALSFLCSLKSVRTERISFQSLDRRSVISRLPHVLWWHFDTSRQLPSVALNPEVVSTVRAFVQKGGSLLLSLLAAQYVLDLGVEELKPNVTVKGAWEEANWAPEYPDIRGFGTYLGHPVFEGLPGGAYTWNPVKGDQFCAAYYEGIAPTRGSVVAVDRQYIRLNEQRRIVCEYRVGEGRILTVGSYFFFQKQDHRFRPDLERFTSNCISYLSQPLSKARGKRTYWSFETRTVTQVERSGSKRLKTGSMAVRLSEDNQVITRDLGSKGTQQAFDVGGKRILIAGKERGGISEVWCHPIRIVRNLKTAFKVGNTEPQWSHELSVQLTARPECIQRVYTIGNAKVEETVFGDRDRPCGAIHFRADSLEPVEIIVTATVDLRLMWPLSDSATGSLTYTWDRKLQAFVINARHPNCCALIGSAVRPLEQMAGQFSEINVDGERLYGNPTSDITVTIALRIRLSGSGNDDAIYFAGSHLGEEEAERSYRTIAKNPDLALAKQSKHFRNLSGRWTQIETADPEFNEAYSWAQTSTDRFSADVPGLGLSLLAGHGTTERGWNGGHANSGRPGYAWYFGRDSAWTSFALLGSGDFNSVKSVLLLLGTHQDPSGKIPHELTTSGFAHYDAADSTPLYIILLGKYLKATGDTAFMRNQFDRLLRAMEFCFSTDTDHDHLIENTNVGHGWVEGGQLFPAHCEHYLASCWAKALEEASDIASFLHKQSLAGTWGAEAKKISRIIERGFWNERTQFYNFAKLADGTFNEEKTLLPAVGISFGYGLHDHAAKCLEDYASAKFSADWGTRIVGKDNPLFDPAGYHYGSIWPLFTGWTSLAEFKLGRPVQGFVHAMNNLLLYNQFAAGYIEEVFHGEVFQPAGVCSHQAWSESMAIQPILDGMLGLEPDAIRHRLSLRPYFPPDWNSATCTKIPLGERRIDFAMKRRAGSTQYEFQISKGKPVAMKFQPYFPLGTRLFEIVTNGKPARPGPKLIRSYKDCPTVEFKLTGKMVLEFKHARGVSLVPPIPRPVPMQPSTGIRIIDESWDNRRYILTVEGKHGMSYSIILIDPDSTISSVQNAEIRENVNGRVSLRVTFNEESGEEEYQRKTIVCTT